MIRLWLKATTTFPLKRFDPAVLKPSATTTMCPWKGTAQYYTLLVDGAENRDAAWFYAEPKEKAAAIRGRSRSGRV
jgi:uncharacterized protein (DUF427 family)